MLDLALVSASLTLGQTLVLANFGLDITWFHLQQIASTVPSLVREVSSLLLLQLDLNRFGLIMDQEKS